MRGHIKAFFALSFTGNRQFQNTKVSKLARSYTNVTCQLLLCWAFGDAFGTVIGSVTFFNTYDNGTFT